MFDVWQENVAHPAYADFSVFMPMSVVAPKEDVNEDDLRDACAEVCNVFSSCIASQISAEHEVGIGLPMMATHEDFQDIAKGSVLTFAYRCGRQIKKVFVLVYGVFLAPQNIQ